MAKKITKTDPNLVDLIKNLKEKSYNEEVAIWKDIAKRIQRATRRRAEVNLSKINRFSNTGETVLIPGKVLASGDLDHKVNVVALNFSNVAKEKIEKSGGECIFISNILEKNPKGTNIRILE
ncbi:MAG: 50S ribosomal protein L18e [Methanobacteriaceae archaeon]|jgi:large subunit ribosomal protein L18e|nr:50S ribosomal protein L18e [Candidatus Methanorudis spinitermitis]